MAVQMTKSQLIEKIATETEISKKEVKGVLETLASIGYKELKKSGVFLLPGKEAAAHRGDLVVGLVHLCAQRGSLCHRVLRTFFLVLQLVEYLLCLLRQCASLPAHACQVFLERGDGVLQRPRFLRVCRGDALDVRQHLHPVKAEKLGMKFRLRAGARHAVLLFFLQCLHTRASFRLCCGRGARSAIQPK